MRLALPWFTLPFIVQHQLGGWKLPPFRHSRRKKTDVAKYLEVFDHVGLLVNEPPGLAGLPFI
jgi:hypothetical protein